MRAAPVLISTGVLAVIAAGVGVAVASDGGSDTTDVGAVDVGAVTVDATDPATTTPDGSATAGATASPSASVPPAPAQQVEGLEVLQGVLTRDDDSDRDDDDRTDFEVAGIDLELGPDSWLLTAGPIGDYDGDGTTAPVLDELEALVGQEVDLAGRYEGDEGDEDGDRDDDFVVYEVNGLTFRDNAGGPAPWEAAGAGGDAATEDEVVQVALEAVGAGSRLDSVDREDDGGAAWEVEVVDADGQEQRVLLDSAGAVLDIRPED